LQEDGAQFGRTGPAIYEGSDRLVSQAVHSPSGLDPTGLPGGALRGEDSVGDAREELTTGLGHKRGDQGLDSAGLVTVAVSEGVERDRQPSRTEQGEPGDEGLESSDPGAEVPIVRVLVPDHDLGLRAPEPDGSLALSAGH